MKILHCSEIDIIKWQSLAIQSGEIYNDYHYLSACTGNNWATFIWGNYVSVFPFYQKKKWHIIPYVSMPTFFQKYNIDAFSSPQLDKAFQYLIKNNFIVDIALNRKAQNIDCQLKTNIVLDTQGQTYEAINSSYSSRLIRNLKKHKEVEIEEVFNYDSVSNFILHITANNDKYSYFDREAFENIIQHKEIKKKCYIAKNQDNKIVGVLLCPVFEKKIYITFPYVNSQGRKVQAMSHLIDKLIQDNIGSIIDFEGSSIKGIKDFYLQFGGEEENYYQYNYRKI